MVDALGIELTDAPPSLLMSIEDFGRLRLHRENMASRELASAS